MPGAEKILGCQVKKEADTTKSELDNYPVEFRLDLVKRLKAKEPSIVRLLIKYFIVFKFIILISCPFSCYAN